MAFSELSFLFFLFPLALALHTAAPKGLRQPILLAVSLVFLAWGSPEYVLLFALVIVFNYLSVLQLQKNKALKAGLVL